ERRLRIGDDGREAGGDGTEVDALRLAGEEGRLVEGGVLHRGVIDGVAHLPASDVLQKGGTRNPGDGRRWIGEVRHLGGYRQCPARQAQLAGQDVHAGHSRATDHRVQRVAADIAQARYWRVRGARDVGAEQAR